MRGTKGAFHGDQHSAQGPVGLAAAIAIAEYLNHTHTSGSVTVFGAPGEEMMPPNAKTEMHLAHAFDGMDILVRGNAASVTSRPAHGFGTCCLNIIGAKYTFSGAPAHQMQSWNGRNALEAVIHFFVNINSVRSSIRPEARIQGVILEGGTAPNVVPAPAPVIVAPHCGLGEQPRFRLGFATLSERLGERMGAPTSCEYSDPRGSRDTLQETDRGLAVYRPTTSTTSFISGDEHWALVGSSVVYWAGDSIDPPATTVALEA